MKVLVYTYYSEPWKMRCGDDIRIHSIVKTLKKHTKATVIVYNLSHLANRARMFKDDVVYVSVPRKTYSLMARLLGWKQHHDLNSLIKLTHYIDEFIAVTKLANTIKHVKTLYIFGAMSLFSLFARILGIKNVKIIYDPLANYAQTLHLRSSHNKIELIRYGLYLALHKLQLKYSNYVIYPSKTDLENAKRIFNVKNTMIIPNPIPVCYKSVEEYMKLRMKRKDFSKPYFILLAGGRGRTNEEAVKLTIKVFNTITTNHFRLFITGPWQDMKKHVKNSNIEILGIVSHDKLKELLAISDYGLSPIFSHASGTFLKVLSYIASGLSIIATPQSLIGIDREYLFSKRVYLVRDKVEYKKLITKILQHRSGKAVFVRRRSIILCDIFKNNIIKPLRILLSKICSNYTN